MSEELKKQPNENVFDQENLLAFFELLLRVDKRLNPQNYEVKNND